MLLAFCPWLFSPLGAYAVLGGGGGGSGIATTTQLTVSPAGSIPVGTLVTLTATITASSGGTPTGSVSFYNFSSGLLGTVTLTSPRVSLMVTLPAGTDTVNASYSGDATFAASVSADQTVVVVNAPPSVSLTLATAGPFTAPADIRFNVNAQAYGGGVITSLALYQDGTLLYTDPILPTPLPAVTVSLPVQQLPAGTYSFTVVATDGNGVTATSNAVSVTVMPPPALDDVADWSIDDIGEEIGANLKGGWSWASAINNRGWVAGSFVSNAQVDLYAYASGEDVGGSSLEDPTYIDITPFGGLYNTEQCAGYTPPGSYFATHTNAVHAFRYEGHGTSDGNGPEVDELTLGGSQSWATGINIKGWVVGYTSELSHLFPNGGFSVNCHAFRYDDQGRHDLTPGMTNFSRANGINQQGQIVGDAAFGLYQPDRAFLFEGMQNLGTLDPTGTFSTSTASAINDNGNNPPLVVGSSGTADSDSEAFRYAGGLYPLGTLPTTFEGLYPNSWANGINAKGKIVGASTMNGPYAPVHAVIYEGTTLRDLGTVEADNGGASVAYGINADGLIVGTSNTDTYDSSIDYVHAMLYDGAMHDLSTRPEVKSAGWQVLTEARAINESGEIVGTGRIGGQEHAYRLHPQSNSWYVRPDDSKNPQTIGQTLYNLGCAQTNQRGVTILDFDQPSKHGKVFGTVYSDANNITHFMPISFIETVTKKFLDGYHGCSGHGVITLGVGVNNHGRVALSAASTSDQQAHAWNNYGQAWGEMVARLVNYVASNNYGDRITVVGASDIELELNTFANTNQWVDGYISGTGAPYYDYGNATDCSVGKGICKNNWSIKQVWYVAAGNQDGYKPVPEIYNTHEIQAKNWAAVSKYAYDTYGKALDFEGAMTQEGACQTKGDCGATTLNTPLQGWQQLMDNLYDTLYDPAHADAVPDKLYSTDINYVN
ncbi:MAG: Ig-like domain repeat protein [Sulfuricaulis sp.]